MNIQKWKEGFRNWWFKNKRKQTSFAYCPSCRFELLGSLSRYRELEDGLTKYMCCDCDAISFWDLNAPVPLLIKWYKN